MSQLPQKQMLIPKNPEKPVLLICNTQNRSKATLAALKEQGYQNIRYVEGGMSLLRVRIREGKRFTIFDIDPATALQWADAMKDWAATQNMTTK